jgi:ATP adenylyltransferase
MDILYAPWRDKYVKHSIKHKDDEDKACVFCTIFAAQETVHQEFILKQTEHVIILLNIYPYNSGHLLILPRMHVANLEDLSKEVRTEMMELMTASIVILKEIFQAEGINTGANLGKASGAGIPGHLHLHVVPRWTGDTSFITVIGETKNISVDLKRIYNELKPAFTALEL